MSTNAKSSFITTLYDCILFEFAATVTKDKTYTLPLKTLGDSFSHVLNLYRADQVTRQLYIQLSEVQSKLEPLASSSSSFLSSLQEFIQRLEDGCSDLFPYAVSLYTPDGTLTSSMTDMARLMQSLSLQVPSLSVPGLTHCDKHRFMWEYGQNVPATYHNDIAILLQSLRDNVWGSNGSGGDFSWLANGRKGVRKFSKGYERTMYLEHRQQDLLEAERLDGVLPNTIAEIRYGMANGVYDGLNQYIYGLDRTLTSSSHNEVEALQRKLERQLRVSLESPSLRIDLFGSYTSGLSTLTSDADFTITTVTTITTEDGDEQKIPEPDIIDLGRAMRVHGYRNVQTIAGARVPIVMFMDPISLLRCDININQPLGVHNSELIATYRKIDYRFRPLWLAIRQIAKGNNILDGKNGFLSSYALTMMLIVFLQDGTRPAILPSLQFPPFEDTWMEPSTTSLVNGHSSTGHRRPRRSRSNLVHITAQKCDCTFDHNWSRYRHFGKSNTKTTGELLIDFCYYFGHTFNYSEQEVNPRRGRIQLRHSLYRQRRNSSQSTLSSPKEPFICIMDPFIINRNVARGCRGSNAIKVQRCFQDTYTALSKGDLTTAFPYAA
ncbi:MAG: hypothetical protein J3Q66DRAFT_359163 [Benniella sp.]|nr:MAG: hypothetical protein J3Q66DRAFT_359163 [Benniella sp.]